MNLADIPRTSGWDRRRVAAYLAAPPSPIILTDVMDHWGAMTKWSFDYFAEHFGAVPVRAYAPQFPGTASWGVRMTVSDYVAYLTDPITAPIVGDWLVGDEASLRLSGFTLYAGNFNPAHSRLGRPSLIFAEVPEYPTVLESWLPLLGNDFADRCLQFRSHHFVFLSVAGGVTPLHHDFWDTHAFLAQVRGEKRAILFAPQHAEVLYRDAAGDVREMLNRSQYRDVNGWAGVLSPGDFLLIPSRWLHFTETLTDSVTYSADWIDASNWRSYLASALAALEV